MLDLAAEGLGDLAPVIEAIGGLIHCLHTLLGPVNQKTYLGIPFLRWRRGDPTFPSQWRPQLCAVANPNWSASSN
jgi:hypothetical protein